MGYILLITPTKDGEAYYKHSVMTVAAKNESLLKRFVADNRSNFIS